MNNELDDLKRDYKAIAAPPHLATRIHASVADSRHRTGFWMPAAVTCTAVVALVWVLPFTTQVSSNATSTPTRPSMSALAALKPSKPTTPAPSMSQIRSVSVPRMPAKPKPAATSQPQTNYHFENKTLQEKNDAYI